MTTLPTAQPVNQAVRVAATVLGETGAQEAGLCERDCLHDSCAVVKALAAADLLRPDGLGAL